MPKAGKKPKAIWLDEGLKILEEAGPGSLSIDNLSVRTGKTKGSFYHHFRSREKYLEDLLGHYERKTTVEIVHAVDAETDQKARLKKLTELVFQISSKLELVVRAWALYEPVVKSFQDRIDQKRLEHLEQLYLPSCVSPTQARSKAYKSYSIYIGIQQIRHLYDPKKFKRLLKDLFLT